MKYLTGHLAALGATLRNFLRSPDTEGMRPEESRSERYRASFALLHDDTGEEACIGCKLCANICPSQVITVIGPVKRVSPVTEKKRGYHEDFTLDLQACIYCELCVAVCPTDAIVMMRTQEEPSYSREDLVLTMDKLYANEISKKASWGTGSKLREHTSPKRNLQPEGGEETK